MAVPPAIVLARVEGLIGLHGMVRLRSFTRPPDNLLGYIRLYCGEAGAARELAVRAIEPRQRGFAATFRGIGDRDEAASLVGLELWVPRDSLPAPAPGEFYWADLIGFEVRGEDGEALGRVTGFLETAAHDVMVLEDGGRERLIPFVREVYVRRVDLGAGRIDVNWRREYDP